MRIINGRIITEQGIITGGIEFDERIKAVGSDVYGHGDIDAKGYYIIPGLVDIHSHGCLNEDASDGNPEGLPIMSRYYAAAGVTSWCPTTMTLKEDKLIRAVDVISSFVRPEDGARMVGINLEGPFLSDEKKGAQNADNLHLPDVELLKRIIDASGNNVCLITVAPELFGAYKFIKEASKHITVSIGHTAATYGAAIVAYNSGASHMTHLFNGMTPIHHREPGVVLAAAEAKATAELIVDGLHIHPAVVRMAFKLFGRRMVLISDSLRSTGMPDGEYTLGGQGITVKEGKATITGTDILAGSSVHLMECLRRSIVYGIPIEDAVYAATLAPAKVIRRDKDIGSLTVGKYADIVILDKRFNVKEVFIGGKRISNPY